MLSQIYKQVEQFVFNFIFFQVSGSTGGMFELEFKQLCCMSGNMFRAVVLYKV